MIDVSNTAALIQQLAQIDDLSELRNVHTQFANAEEIARTLLHKREAQKRRNARIKEPGLAIVSQSDG